MTMRRCSPSSFSWLAAAHHRDTAKAVIAAEQTACYLRKDTRDPSLKQNYELAFEPD
jgi:hypothetical protein